MLTLALALGRQSAVSNQHSANDFSIALASFGFCSNSQRLNADC